MQVSTDCKRLKAKYGIGFTHAGIRRPARCRKFTTGKNYEKNDGTPLSMDYEKMSKSKRNGVDPLDVLENIGVDMTRLQLLDSAAPRQEINWGESDLRGLRKWLDRVSWVVSAYVKGRSQQRDNPSAPPIDKKIENELHENYNFFVRNASMCLEVLNLHNTALMRLQGFTNALRKLDPSVIGSSPEAERCVYALVAMMQVFTPFVAAEFRAALLSVPPVQAAVSSSLLDEIPWPQVDNDCDIDFMLVVNGIGCGRVAVPRREIERLPSSEIIERAKTREHKDIFEKFEEKGFSCESISTTVREGLHVTVNVRLQGEIDGKEISRILNDLQRKWRAMNKRKKRVGEPETMIAK